MITHTYTSYISRGITVRVYTSTNFFEASQFSKKWDGQINKINDVWKIKV